MQLPGFHAEGLSISGRLLLWFLAIALIPCLLLTGVFEYLSTSALDRSMRRGLQVISETKTEAIENFVKARRGDAALAGRLKFVVEAVNQLGAIVKREGIASEAYRRESATYRKFLSYYQDAYGYTNVYLFGLDGTMILKIRDDLDVGDNLTTGPLKDTELADVFDRSKMLLQSVFADYQQYPGFKEPMSFISHPILDTNGTIIGIITLQIGNAEVYRILRELNGLGRTGETVAGQLRGDEVTLVAPTRYDPAAAFRRKSKVGDDRMNALQSAVLGRHGNGDAVDYRGVEVVAVWSYIPSLRWGLVVKQDTSEAYAVVYRQRWIIAGLLGLTLLTVTLVARRVARSLSHPIEAAAEAADRVANGDLSAEIHVKAKGEAGKLLRSIRKMTQDLRSLIGKIQKSSISLMSTATEIAATSRQQEQSVHEYGTSTNEAAAAVKEISATSQELLRTMNEVNEVAGDTAELATAGQESLAGMDKTMRHLADSTASIGSKLSVISERAANINVVVTTITKVADQTNLLSINAAIEAEKAGEYGLGFLVVAREIRRLADMTAVSTLDIERMVKEMQYSVSAGVMEMDKFSDQVRQGVREVANIAEQLGKIISAVQGITGRFDQVTEGMRVQAQGADQIREAVVHLSEGVNQTLTSLREFNQATYQLREAVGGLKDEVSRFQIGATA